ncbi:DUF3326 domain-containing protein [Prochlorococcus sp. MIT 1223]|uniref:DUF3326 domain-containing protein n=1 Tax=Prochlorococcus sp. MIT 1223 TaxID=3096217 RepID=UPI002A7590AC|nr:DUF3326 domain-containing protein [Prochlorococcus sp. MIT 1223]
MIVPTGIGCSIGGYAGDAIPSARLLAAASGCLITHPNVMNAAVLTWNDPRIQYVEGYSIDRFASGTLSLRPVRQQKIGLLLDAGLEPDLYQRHLQVADACKASLGLNIGPVVQTEFPLDIDLNLSSSGTSGGIIQNPDVLLAAGEKLKALGSTAIAVVSRFPDDSETESFKKYRLGKGVDVLSGAEAVISHLLVKHLMLPSAHAPALASLPVDSNLDPRAAAEDLGHTFLPSVLIGLSRSPDLVEVSDCRKDESFHLSSSLISVEKLGAIIAPQEALGGEAVLACLEKKIPLIAVSNPGVLRVDLDSLGIINNEKLKYDEDVIFADNYLEAAGIVLALREGIAISSLRRPIEAVSMSSRTTTNSLQVNLDKP